MKKTKPEKKAKYSMAQSIGYMLRMAWDTRRRVPFVCLLLALLNSGQSILQLFLAPEILKRVEDAVPLSELLIAIGLFTLAIMLLSGVIKYVDTNAVYSRIEVRSRIIIENNYKAGTTSYPNTLDPEFLKLRERASLVATRSNNEATEHVWTTITDLITNIICFAVYLLLLKNLDWRLLIVVLVTTVIGFLVTRRVQRWDHDRRDEEEKYEKQLEYIHKKSGSAELAKDIRIFGLREWLDGIYSSVLRLYRGFINRRERAYAIAGAADVILSIARNGIAYFVLISMALTEGLPASQFLLYFTAITGFTAWITGILNQCADLHKECLDLSCVMEYHDYPEPFRFEGGIPVPNMGKDGYSIELEHVSFRYKGADKDTIRDMSLKIRPGEKLAVVGLNGAGKTTLVKLLCGLLDPTEGRVLLNGTDIREFNRREYYKLFSAVFQEFSVLDVTVAENVAQAVSGIDRARVADCLEKAGLTETVAKLKDGIDTHVGREVYLDGVLFSGGQTQRLMLARALYKNGAILVLDEPTAALDPIAENDIYMKYNDMTAGKTSVFISHRLASTRFCDRIIFLADGSITEEGTHDSLLKLGGGYAELFEVQSRYYRDGREF